jgi:23S rRNA (adenine1618-N6)-methyltransferase
MPFPSDFSFTLPNTTLEDAARRLNATLEELDLQWQYRPSLATGVGFARTNVWSRAARRQQQKGSIAGANTTGDEEEEDEPALGFKIRLRLGNEKQEIQVLIRWLRGHDSVLFESFCGMLKRQVSRT